MFKKCLMVTSLLFLSAVPAAAQSTLEDLYAKRAGVSVEEAKSQIQAVFATVQQELIAGKDVSIRGFGKFRVSHVQPRTARNPRTGEPVQVPAKKYPRFTSSDALKEAVNKG